MTKEILGSLREVFEAAGATRVVWIDDLFDEIADPQLGIELAGALQLEKAAGRLPPHVAFKDLDLQDEFAWSNAVSTATSLPEEARRELLKSLGGQARPEFTDAQLKVILESAGSQVETLGFRDWSQRNGELKSQIDGGTIVVVDRDLQRGGSASDGGEAILKEIVSDCPSVCAVMMLTHSVSPDHTESMRTEIATRCGLGLETFAVVSKQGADAPQSAEKNLRQAFRVVFTHRSTHRIVAAIARSMQAALVAAERDLVCESVYHLDRILFQNSFDEGASEIDVVARLLLLRLRVAADANMAADLDIAGTVARLRKIRASDPLEGQPLVNSSPLGAWRQDEVFDPAERVNIGHAPLMCGDIFARGSGGKMYVLLGQPCDLAVRSDGHRNSNEAFLVALVRRKRRAPAPQPASPDAAAGVSVEPKPTPVGSIADQQLAHDRDDDDRAALFKLPHLPALVTVEHEPRPQIDFRTSGSADLSVLEWACFEKEGRVAFQADAERPVGLRPGWSIRWDSAKKLLADAKQAYDGMSSKPSADEFAARFPKLAISRDLPRLAKWLPAKHQAAFDLQRVGRLRPPWAVAAYAAFSSYHARVAFDHDFARGLASE